MTFKDEKTRTTQIQRIFPATLTRPWPQHCRKRLSRQDVPLGSNLLKTHIEWKKIYGEKDSFLASCLYNHMSMNVIQFLRIQSCPTCDWGIIKYFSFTHCLFLQNDEYADLKFNFFVPKKMKKPSPWWCPAFTDGSSEGITHHRWQSRVSSKTSPLPPPRRKTLWVGNFRDAALLQNPGLVQLLWITPPSAKSKQRQQIDIISNSREGRTNKGQGLCPWTNQHGSQ